MYAYCEAIRQMRELGYVTDDVRARLTPADLQRASEEASKSE